MLCLHHGHFVRNKYIEVFVHFQLKMLGILLSVMIKTGRILSKLYFSSKIVFNDIITLSSHYKNNLWKKH